MIREILIENRASVNALKKAALRSCLFDYLGQRLNFALVILTA